MKINPQKVQDLVKQGAGGLIATSRDFLRRFDSSAPQDATALDTYDESILQQGRFWMRTVTWTLIGTTVFGVGWLALARTEEIVVAAGQLEPVGSVQDIQMPVGGVADQILVEEGDSVKAGQVLMKLDTEATEEQRLSLEKTIKLKREQLTLKQEEKHNTMQVNQEEVLMLENNLELQSEILKRYEQLKSAGAFSEVQYLSQQNVVAEIQGRLMQSKADRLRQMALLDQQTAQLKSELADLNGKLVETKVTLRYQQLKSPVDGVVFDLKPTSRGFTAQSTQTVMKVVPTGSLEAKVEVPSNKIGFVKVPFGCPEERDVCMNADISIDSFPSTDFGVLNGKVSRIGSDALEPDPQEQRQVLSFPVTIQLDSQQLKLKNGSSLPLQVGMSLTANIKLRKVSYLQLLLGEFQDKAQSLQRL
ncbi:type I secretion system ABC transporter/ HlyD family [Synechococcus sp. RS9907]|uniref:HlyD family secretion protein n=1 Tax=Synechococcus sp. RS9907 TaxID=221350 RepID=UPI00165D874C|nr:HlyD family efflux transporter periplasmic adaptor subunit [Synechococcus sp. RS9907]QNI81054.1 type I secretion system ABC transporter/ HlyD family [Synechococcus sp. RS9907]